jgi:hypothetical protein
LQLDGKNRAMLRSLRPPKNCLAMRGQSLPAGMRRVTLSCFIAAPLGAIIAPPIWLSKRRNCPFKLIKGTENNSCFEFIFPVILFS